MVYELRVYRCMPGRKADVLARFRNHTMALFRKHGIECVGFWDTVVGENDELIYINKFASWEEREKKWAAFQTDPHRLRVLEESHASGPIVEHARTALLQTTDFSPPI
jgi:NIPSNAP protein